MKNIKNKKADLTSIIIIVCILFIFSLIAIFGGYVILEVSKEIKTIPEFQNNTVETTVNFIQDNANNFLDFFIFILFIGLVIGLIIFSSTIEISPVYIGVFIMLMIIVIFLAGIFANMFSEIIEDEEISNSANQFKLTKFVLGSNFPIIILGVIIITLVILYGKSRVAV